MALGSKYSDAAAAEWELWRDDVLRFSREAARGSRLRSQAAVEAGLNPKSPLEFPNGLNALLSTEYYSGGSRLRSAGRVAEGMSAVQPFGYGYVDGLNIVSYPYGQKGAASLVAASGQIEAYDRVTGTSLSGATVVMRNVDTGATYTGTTDSDPNQYPHYWITPAVEAGTYTFTVSKAGYQTFTETDGVGGAGWGLAFPLTPTGGGGGGGGTTPTNWALIAVAGIVIIGGFALTRRKR